MHPARAFAWPGEAAMRAFAADTAFARLFLTTPQGPRVAHAPLLTMPDGAFRFHLANMNALAPHLDGATVLALFEGPNGYLSANWYEDVRGNVPSWELYRGEAEGIARPLDQGALVALLDHAAAVLEPRVGEDWTRAKMEPRRFEALTRAITAFELTPTAWRGTLKASQSKPAHEAGRLIAGMGRASPAMAAAMRAVRA